MNIVFCDQAWSTFSSDAENDGVISQYIVYIIERARKEAATQEPFEKHSQIGDVVINYEVTPDKTIIKSIVDVTASEPDIISERAARGDKDKFLKVISRVPDAPPHEEERGDIDMLYEEKNEILFEYPSDALPVFILFRNSDSNKYHYEVDTAVEYETELSAKAAIKTVMHEFALWMVNNGHDVSRRMRYDEVFQNGISFDKGYDTIEEAYASFRLLAGGFCYGYRSTEEVGQSSDELIDLVKIGYDPVSKVWVAFGQPPIEFTLEHENIITLAERVWKIIPEIKELNSEAIHNGPDTLEKWLNSCDDIEGYGLFSKNTWESKELLPILQKYNDQMQPEMKQRLCDISGDDEGEDKAINCILYDQLTIVERLENADKNGEFEDTVQTIKKEIFRKLCQH